MSLLDRILRIAKAEMNTVLDGIEDPEAMFEQALRDGELEIQSARARLRDVVANRLRIEDELDREKLLVSNWEDRAANAVSADNEALAREALKVAAQHRRQAFLIEESLVHAREEEAAMEAALTRRQGQVRLMNEQKEHILNQIRYAQVEDMTCGAGEESPLDHFDRMKEKVDQTYYRGKAAEHLAENEENLARQFEHLQANQGPSQAVQDKLAELKARLNNT